jgi:excisionase family DNA binding protein
MKTSHNAETLDDTGNRLLGKREMAPQLRISRRTLDLWMAKGWVPYFKIGRSVRFKLDDVLEKLNQHRIN